MLPFRAEVILFPFQCRDVGFGVCLSVGCTSLRQSGERTSRCLRRCVQRKGEATFSIPWQHTDVLCHVILATWRTTALIAATTDTMSTRITSREAITEPKNRAASTSPITADAIKPNAVPYNCAQCCPSAVASG